VVSESKERPVSAYIAKPSLAASAAEGKLIARRSPGGGRPEAGWQADLRAGQKSHSAALVDIPPSAQSPGLSAVLWRFPWTAEVAACGAPLADSRVWRDEAANRVRIGFERREAGCVQRDSSNAQKSGVRSGRAAAKRPRRRRGSRSRRSLPSGCERRRTPSGLTRAPSSPHCSLDPNRHTERGCERASARARRGITCRRIRGGYAVGKEMLRCGLIILKK
jgi:hypothetical protein